MCMPPATLGAASSVDDALLVERVQRDDEAAFRALYARHSHYIAGVVYRLMGDDAELDDIVEETFVDAAGGLGALEDPTSLRRWLVVVAVRKVKTLLGRRRRRRFRCGGTEPVAAPDDREHPLRRPRWWKANRLSIGR